MKKELLEFIKTLSLNDKKNLIEKTLKTSEEVGELAKVVLPYENAAGTLHRIVQRRQILENAIDTMLCAMSIAYDLKYSDEEIEDMLLEKSKKWSGIQEKEGSCKFPLPFEIHITIDLSNSKCDVEHFKTVCERVLEIKPIIIELEKNGVNVMNDVMTSSVHFGDNNSAILASENLSKTLKAYGYAISRVKIETVPWHPAAPREGDEMPDDCYFESHLRIVTTTERKDELEMVAGNWGAHLSRNFFKKLKNDEYIIMMTLRDRSTDNKSFKAEVDHLKEELLNRGFLVDKTEIEFAIYDSNRVHDSIWINN